MKRYGYLLAGAAVGLALTGMLLSLAVGRSPAATELVSRGCFLAAALCFIVAALLRPRSLRVGAAEGFGMEMGRTASSNYTFRDVAANDEARNSLLELADYLKCPRKYVDFGARMPRGVLLYGPPGTGKTLLAKALAGEAGVPFFALSGSDFVQMYVGVGAGRVRELFRNARRAGRCVVFIDEIDALGKRREQAASDERDQTLNALLSEMSGFRDAEGILVLAATNRPEALDPALLRPGRFDRQIEVGLPGRIERLSILKLHSRNKPLSREVDLEALAADTVAFSGASLENLLNEAAIAAAGRGAELIGAEDVRAAFYRMVAGSDRESQACERERRIIAVHEAGHALAAHLLTPENRLRRVSILPTGRGAAGYSLTIPAERVMLEKRDIERQIQVLLAGRAAESLIYGEEALTAGSSNDLTRAAELAASMVMDLGMAGEPAVSLRAVAASCGGGTEAAALCKHLLDGLYGCVEALLTEHRDALVRLAEHLAEREVMSGEEVERLLKEAA